MVSCFVDIVDMLYRIMIRSLVKAMICIICLLKSDTYILQMAINKLLAVEN